MWKASCAFALAASLVVPTAARAEQARPSANAGKRHDPRGIKGISPFVEALKKGDSAFIARDFAAAIAAYREAITQAPENPLGHYRVGEAQLAKGDLHEAEEAFVTGLRFVADSEAALKGKLQFALADLKERQKAYDSAAAKWGECEAWQKDHKLASGASAAERKKVVEAWQKLSADSREVKARIDKGLKAADEAVRKSSK